MAVLSTSETSMRFHPPPNQSAGNRIRRRLKQIHLAKALHKVARAKSARSNIDL
jgi:hypothetical protein